MWSVDSRDYLMDGTEPLVERVQTAPLTAGDILLFHDDNQYTAAALEPILRTLDQRGFSFATVSEILGSELQLGHGPHGPRCAGHPKPAHQGFVLFR